MSAAAKQISLALQGGGTHGAFTWGVLDRLLDDERIDIRAISGTSAGAMNGAMLTYGSYLKKDDDIVTASLSISVLDTLVALLACLILFPITFTHGMEPAAGPSLVFQNIPIALSQLPGSTIWAVMFFLLLVFAALTSAISLLEVACSYFIDELGWSRSLAVPVTGGAIIEATFSAAQAGMPSTRISWRLEAATSIAPTMTASSKPPNAASTAIGSCTSR